MQEILERMGMIRDPRNVGYIKYKLSDILFIAMCGVLSGLDTLSELTVYEHEKEDFFKNLLEIETIPSKATFGRISSMLDGKEVGDAILFRRCSPAKRVRIVSNGRKECRTHRKKDLSQGTGCSMVGCTQVARIEQRVCDHADRGLRGRHSEETSYYLSSLDASAKELSEIVREHWKIESMHWLLDVTFSEDPSQFMSENAHKTMNSLRKFALAVHKNFLAASGKNAPSRQVCSPRSSLRNSSSRLLIFYETGAGIFPPTSPTRAENHCQPMGFRIY